MNALQWSKKPLCVNLINETKILLVFFSFHLKTANRSPIFAPFCKPVVFFHVPLAKQRRIKKSGLKMTSELLACACFLLPHGAG
jgi:hypothetical protein